MKPESTNFCVYCRELAISQTESNMAQHWPTLARLRASAPYCACCHVLLVCLEERAHEALDRFRQFDMPALEQFPLTLYLSSTHSLPSGLNGSHVEAAVTLPNKVIYPVYLTIASCEASSLCAKSPCWTDFPTFFDTKISKIRDWLRYCDDYHPKCKQGLLISLPKRLIDLDCQGTRSAQLVFSEDIDAASVKYTVLSYCWGNAKPMKTVKSSVDDFHSEVPETELPQTLADAFYITRKLGVRYIWIDALCIVQDDPMDWEAEAAKMGDVYAGSVLTLVASEADSSAGGWFVQHTGLQAENKPSERVFLHVVSTKYDSELRAHIVPVDGRISALNKRGWALQEAVLSRRAVQVTNSELRWRCRSELLWETGIEYENGDRLYGNVPGLRAVGERKKDHLWWLWMESYAKRRFTVPRDRLAALVGITEFYQRVISDKPCLGLWESSLHEDMVWRRDSTASERSIAQRTLQNFPSWSPLSSAHDVKFDPWRPYRTEDPMVQYYLRVLRCIVFWGGRPYLSDLHLAKLVVNGPVQTIYLSEATEINDCNPPYFDVDDEIADFSNIPLTWRCAVQWDTPGQRPPKEWLCLLLRRAVAVGYESGGETFLVLEPIEQAESELVFRRVGIGSLGRSGHVDGLKEQEWKFNLAHCRTITLV